MSLHLLLPKSSMVMDIPLLTISQPQKAFLLRQCTYLCLWQPPIFEFVIFKTLFTIFFHFPKRSSTCPFRVNILGRSTLINSDIQALNSFAKICCMISLLRLFPYMNPVFLQLYLCPIIGHKRLYLIA